MTDSTQVHDPQPVTSGEPPQQTSGGKLFTVREVVNTCGVSESTVKRRLKENPPAFPSAFQARAGGDYIEGTWLIPLTDLLAAGYNPGRPTEGDPEAAFTADRIAQSFDGSIDLTDGIAAALRRAETAEADAARLREREAMLTLRADSAERLAGERDRTIRLLETSLRMLEAGPTASRSRPPVARQVDQGHDWDQPHRRWWQRWSQPVQS